MNRIRCFTLPSRCDEVTIGSNVVVIDVLRASTTICSALFHGARCIWPFRDIVSAEKFVSSHSEPVLTGGERGGEKLPGFDLGNSPLEYTPESVGYREIAFTTTNGTAALEKCRNSTNVMIGAFCNITALLVLLEAVQEVDLICAGTDGQMTTEDCAFAGLVVERLSETRDFDLNGDAELCLSTWHEAKPDLAPFLRSSIGGKNLLRLGRDQDIEYCAQLDSVDIVPKLKIDEWKIEPA